MRYLLIACALCGLSGCWFVFIPGSVVGAVTDTLTGASGDHCVAESAKVGGRISLSGGRTATVKSLSGTSSRCTNPLLPIRAELAVDPSNATR